MSDTMLLAVAIGVFIMLVVGILLTIYEFRQTGEEPADSPRSDGDHPGR